MPHAHAVGAPNSAPGGNLRNFRGSRSRLLAGMALRDKIPDPQELLAPVHEGEDLRAIA